ncbi:helix-turn-helix domain-containing protein [Clostridium felsineum]|uniref:helix-turn-helix transcriptional regulator n=1 Tax=Clostridium felsineum TaxID=36839 RepID=UPI00214DCAFF|nr:helix-turn-helix transcriptional regulator [Clostridium felsineum]MCR3758133.1 helix-turn-helix domain-containing protein [Clostridium felsineum]
MTSILTIGEKIKKLRNEYKLNQDDIVWTELTRNLISQIEHGKANLTKSTAELIIRNTKDILEKRGTTIDPKINVEYLLETEESQAKKVIASYIQDLKEISIYKDNHFNELLEQVENLLSKWEFRDLKIEICEIAGDYYTNRNDYLKAYIYYENVKYLIGCQTDMGRVISIFRKLSTVYFYTGNFAEGIRICKYVIERFTDMDDKYKCVFTFNMSLYYNYLGEYEKALKVLAEFEGLIKNTYEDRYYKVLLLKASSYYEVKRYAESLSIYNKLIGITAKDDFNNLCVYYNNMAQVYLGMGKRDMAVNYVNTVVNNLSNLSDKFEALPQIYAELGKTYFMMSDNDRCNKYLTVALKLSKSFNYYSVTKDILNELSKINVNNNKVNLKEEFIILTENMGRSYDIRNHSLVFNIIQYYTRLNDITSISELCEYCKERKVG